MQMAPSVSVLNDKNKENCHPRGDSLKKKEEDVELNGPGDDDCGTIGLCRQLAVSAGLMASDGGLVFLQLTMMPCLQTLGVPVSLVTVAGVISGSLALMGLPILGWISDGGKNPHRRKKPAMVVSALVFVTGYSLVISGCTLRLHTEGRRTAEMIKSESILVTLNPYLNSSTSPESYSVTFASSGPDFLPQEQSTELSINIQTLDMTTSEKSSSKSESVEWMDDPLGMGIPLTGLLGILGFVFMDMGNDFNNSCLKSFILTCTPKKQHNSMFVVGVLMSAVGGCVAAVLGVFDIAALLVSGAKLDAIPAKTLVQAAFFLVFTVVCMLVTVLSAPPFQSSKPVSRTSSPSNAVMSSRQPGYGTMRDDSGKFHVIHDQTGPSNIILKESIVCGDDSRTVCDSDHDESIHSLPYVSVCGTSRPTESNMRSPSMPEDTDNTVSLLTGKKETEKRSIRRCLTKTGSVTDTLQSVSDPGNLEMLNTDDKTRSLSSRSLWDDGKDADISAQQKFLDQNEDQPDHETSDYYRLQCLGQFSVRKTTLRMIPVCVSMFFMAGAWQSFNICATDYLGKVIYGGDPEADRKSQSYIDYQQGMKTGSQGVLMLNIAYVIVNLLQKKIIALIGPKAECLVVCAIQIVVLLSLQLTDEVIVFYMAAIVYGFFRSVMNTVPFMLANTICQQASSHAGKGNARVGSTMALMTAMMPLSFVLVSTFTGPLIHATGDPASPLYYSITTTSLAAAVFAFT